MNLDKFTRNIIKTARERSIGYCAKNVREALEEADGIITKIPLSDFWKGLIKYTRLLSLIQKLKKY